MRTVTTYVLLVGLPILGVLIILRLGQNLTPPVSVGGQWRIESSAAPSSEAACSAAWERLGQSTLSIAQSGPKLVVTLDTTPAATLIGDITEVLVVATESGPVTGQAVTHFEATVDRGAEPDHLSGSFTVPGCSTALPFTAIRQPTSLNGNVNH